jgi:TolB-like protein/DNA-binding winged helix-turn-helix (wHTH) protein/Tfp pilus assembly protein PilF
MGSGVLRFGAFQLKLFSKELRKHGVPLRLGGHALSILLILLERPGEILTRDEIQKRLWRADTFVDFQHGLNTAMKKLRAILDDTADNPRYIETIPRVGYRFVALVHEEASQPAEAAPEVANTPVPVMAAPLHVSNTSRRKLRVLRWAALAVLLLSVGFAIRTRLKSASTARFNSVQAIAVLPLRNISSDSAQEYFSDGITDEIITDLAKLGGPKVISRTSVMQYKGTSKTIPEIARELHVGAILEGSVERSGDRLRVRVQLIDAATDQHLWAETYDRQLSDVLLLEADLAQDIAQQISGRLTPEQQQVLAHNRTLNPQAFQDYLQGRHYWALRTSQSLTTAIDYFNRAIQEDPTDARSYAGLAQCYVVLPMVAKTSQAEDFQKARDGAAKALALDDSLPEAHLAIAEIRLYQNWDFAGAESEFKRTLDLNPNYSTAHQWYGEYLSLMTRHQEALHELQTALALDPLSAIVHLQFGNTLQQARQYDQALDQYHEALNIDPKLSLPFYAMYWVYRRQGKFAESIGPLRLATQSWDAKNDWVALVDQLPAAYSTGGRTGYLRQCIKIHERSERPWLYLARDYADLGDRETALAALNKSYENRELELLWLLVDPELDPLRSDPQFQELTRKVGFPQSSPRIRAGAGTAARGTSCALGLGAAVQLMVTNRSREGGAGASARRSQ